MSRVEFDASWSLGVENLEDLLFDRCRHSPRFPPRVKWRSRIASRPDGITDHPREIADQENDIVSEILELSHLVYQDGMPQVQIRCSRIETGLYYAAVCPSRASTCQAVLGQHLVGAGWSQFSQLYVA